MSSFASSILGGLQAGAGSVSDAYQLMLRRQQMLADQEQQQQLRALQWAQENRISSQLEESQLAESADRDFLLSQAMGLGGGPGGGGQYGPFQPGMDPPQDPSGLLQYAGQMSTGMIQRAVAELKTEAARNQVDEAERTRLMGMGEQILDGVRAGIVPKEAAYELMLKYGQGDQMGFNTQDLMAFPDAGGPSIADQIMELSRQGYISEGEAARLGAKAGGVDLPAGMIADDPGVDPYATLQKVHSPLIASMGNRASALRAELSAFDDFSDPDGTQRNGVRARIADLEQQQADLQLQEYEVGRSQYKDVLDQIGDRGSVGHDAHDPNDPHQPWRRTVQFYKTSMADEEYASIEEDAFTLVLMNPEFAALDPNDAGQRSRLDQAMDAMVDRVIAHKYGLGQAPTPPPTATQFQTPANLFSGRIDRR